MACMELRRICALTPWTELFSHGGSAAKRHATLEGQARPARGPSQKNSVSRRARPGGAVALQATDVNSKCTGDQAVVALAS